MAQTDSLCGMRRLNWEKTEKAAIKNRDSVETQGHRQKQKSEPEFAETGHHPEGLTGGQFCLAK